MSTKPELENMLEEKDKEIEELKNKLAEAQATQSNSSETKNDETNQAAKLGISSETLEIMERERKRKNEMKLLSIPEDPDPDSQNTYHCAVNGKVYSVPKGKEVMVPLAVYENYMEHYEAEKRAKAALKKASVIKQIGGN